MRGHLSIDAGRVMVFSIDTIDRETWSDKGGDPYWRIRRYEQWIHFITDEMVPFMRAMVNERNGLDRLSGDYRLWMQPGRRPRSQSVFPLPAAV